MLVNSWRQVCCNMSEKMKKVRLTETKKKGFLAEALKSLSELTKLTNVSGITIRLKPQDKAKEPESTENELRLTVARGRVSPQQAYYIIGYKILYHRIQEMLKGEL